MVLVQVVRHPPFAGIAPQMVKVIPLGAVVAACWLCAPAQADVLTVPPTTAVTGTVTQVADTVRPVVAQTTTTATAQAPVAAQPAVAAAVRKTVQTTTVQMAPGRADGHGGLRVGASSLRRAPSARLRRPELPRDASAPARRKHAQPAAGDPSDGSPRAAHPAPAGEPDGAHPGGTPEPHPQPAPPTGAGVAAGSGGTGFAAGLALLAAALALVAPRLCRRLRIDVAAPRPFAFVALLERPG